MLSYIEHIFGILEILERLCLSAALLLLLLLYDLCVVLVV